MSVFDDLDSLRNATPEQKQTRTKKWRRQFVRFPWAWAERMKSTQRASTYRLALLLLYEHWRTRGQVIVLSNVGLEQEGLTRRSKWRALAELERLGLLLVERLPRKSPRVTLCYLSGERS